MENNSGVLQTIKATTNALNFLFGYLDQRFIYEKNLDENATKLKNLVLKSIRNTIDNCNFLYGYFACDEIIDKTKILNGGADNGLLNWKR